MSPTLPQQRRGAGQGAEATQRFAPVGRLDPDVGHHRRGRQSPTDPSCDDCVGIIHTFELMCDLYNILVFLQKNT